MPLISMGVHDLCLPNKSSSRASMLTDASAKLSYTFPDSRAHGANMGPTWILSAPGGPHVDPVNLAIRDIHLAVDQHQHVAIGQSDQEQRLRS